MSQAGEERISDGLAPFIPEKPRVLVFGSFPSPATREAGFHFGHPQNRFWPALAGAFHRPVPTTQAERAALLEDGGIFLWNIVSSCRIDGSRDASIREARLNALDEAIVHYSIREVFALGKKAASLYEKSFEKTTGVPCTVLPSPSAANRRFSLDDLIQAYGVIAGEQGGALK